MAYVTTKGAGEETFLTGYVPGGQPMDLDRCDNGAAVFIPKGSGLGLQVLHDHRQTRTLPHFHRPAISASHRAEAIDSFSAGPALQNFSLRRRV